ncbi:uncharacterized protein [Anabrus simplex]|uniref:uncharacterized protein n=1 Tax=Anabrus simplex TaxID=316456 RepID=UPI0035A38FD8
MFYVTGLSLGGGLVIFASVLSDAYMERPRRATSFNTAALYPGNNNNLFDYRYGWSFFAAGVAFIMAELAALLSITAYLRRFPTVEDMVRVMVPGAERRLLRPQGSAGEYLVRQPQNYRRRQNGPPGLWTDSIEYYGTKSDTLVASDLEGVEGPLLLNNTAPDICSANPANVMATEVTEKDNTCGITPTLGVISHHTETSLLETEEIPTTESSMTADYDIPLSGVTTVPITLMRQQPLKPQQVSQLQQQQQQQQQDAAPVLSIPTPTPFLFAQQLQRFGAGTLVHQGVLGVSEGASSSSSSSGTTTGSCHSGPTKYATLQPPHKKKVTISTFSTLEHYDKPKSGTWSNSEV